MDILVTGSAGHLGEALMRTLVASATPRRRRRAALAILGFARFVISATTDFAPSDRSALRNDAAAVLERY